MKSILTTFILMLLTVLNLTASEPVRGDYHVVSYMLRSSGNKLVSKSWDGYKCFFYIDYFNGSKWSTLPRQAINGVDTVMIPFNIESGVDMDKNGNIWASAGGSIWKYDGSRWQDFTLDDTLKPSRSFYGLTVDSAGNIWVITRVQFVSKIIYDSGTKYVLLDKTYHEILKFDGTNFEVMQRIIPPEGEHGELELFEGITTGPDGKIYVSKTKSCPDLLAYNGKTWETDTILIKPSVISKSGSRLYVDKENNLWVCFNNQNCHCGGISKRTETGEWKFFGKDEGIPVFISETTSPVSGIAVDKKGNKFFASRLGTGLIGLSQNESDIINVSIDSLLPYSTLYNTKNNIFDAYWNSIHDIAITSDERIWLATDNGLLVFDNRFSDILLNVENDNYSARDFQLYPNPANNVLYIKDISDYSIRGIQIYSAVGTKIKEMEYKDIIDISDLIPGVYYIRIGDKFERFIKSRE